MDIILVTVIIETEKMKYTALHECETMLYVDCRIFLSFLFSVKMVKIVKSRETLNQAYPELSFRAIVQGICHSYHYELDGRICPCSIPNTILWLSFYPITALCE